MSGPSWTSPGLDTHATFRDGFERQWARDLRVFLLVVTVFNAGFWVTDAAVFASVPGAAATLGDARVATIALAALTYVALGAAPQHATSITAVAGLATCLAVATAFGRIGGPSTPWFHFIYPFALSPIGWYMRPARRVVVTALYGAAVVGGYFWVRPEYLRDPMAASTLGHFGYVVVIGTVVGLYVDRARLRTWEFQQALADERARLAQHVAEQTDDLRRLARRLDDVRENERKHLARELHDELGQTLSALRMALRVATIGFDRGPATIRPHLELLGTLLDDLTMHTRRVLSDLRPAVLDELGLAAAVEGLGEQLSRRGGPSCVVEVPPFARDVPSPVASVAYRCVQEALTNVARHASASTVRVRVEVGAEELRAEVEDDGVGFPVGPTRGLGLLGMRERVSAVGGNVAVDSESGRGTRVRVTIPVAEAS